MALSLKTFLALGCLLVTGPAKSLGQYPIPSIFPNNYEMVVPLHSPFTLKCTGESELSWQHPDSMDEDVEISTEENNSGLFVSLLSVKNATAAGTGMYTCFHNHTQLEDNEIEGKDIYIYVPDPDTAFVPSMMLDHFIAVEEDDSSLIPCRTTSPNAQVSLLNKEDSKVVFAYYDNKQGFFGNFPSGAYVCETIANGVAIHTDTYILHKWKATSEIPVNIEASKTVLKTGENITVTCVVLDNEVVDLEWTYPGKAKERGVIKMVESKSPSLKLTCTLTILNATVKDSGEYECAVRHATQDSDKVKKIVDSVRGNLYWTDWNREAPKIETSFVDGSNRRILVNEDIGLPNGLTYDPFSKQLCWADAGTKKLECMLPNGTGRRLVLSNLNYPFSVVCYANHIYHTDWRRDGVISVNKDTGRLTEEYLPEQRSHLYGITAVHPYCPSGRK